MLISQNKCPKTDKLKRIWEPTYTYDNVIITLLFIALVYVILFLVHKKCILLFL